MTKRSRQAFSTSPELTTGGMLPKAWRYVEHDGIYLYKGGTTGASNTGREPYCEFYASQIAETMRLNAVHYDLENWKGITASKCPLFTDIHFTPHISLSAVLSEKAGLLPVYRIMTSLAGSFLSRSAVCLCSMP